MRRGIADRLACTLVVVGMVCSLLALTGCAAPYEGGANPALFRRGVDESQARPAPLPGRVAVVLAPAVSAQVVDITTQIRLHIGQIVEQATVAALADSLQGGVSPLPAPPPVDAGYSATLLIQAIRFEHRQHLLWLLPLPYLVGFVGQAEHRTTLALDLSLLDAQGRTLWTRTVVDDAGRVVLPNFQQPESEPQALLRLAHDAAWRLAVQLAADHRQWWSEERARPRAL